MGINYNIIYLNILFFFFLNEAVLVWWGSRSIWGIAPPCPCLEPGPVGTRKNYCFCKWSLVAWASSYFWFKKLSLSWAETNTFSRQTFMVCDCLQLITYCSGCWLKHSRLIQGPIPKTLSPFFDSKTWKNWVQPVLKCNM